MAHVRAKHPDFDTQMRSATAAKSGSMLSWVSHKAQNVYGWISWTVEANLPFEFCAKPETRKSAKLAPISAEYLRENLVRLTRAVELEVAVKLPAKFGIVFDGWTHNSEHFLVIFATYDDDDGVHTPLLSLAPIINEPEETRNAKTHPRAIEAVLDIFGKTLSQCAVLVGDNCAVNRRLARLMGIPLLGCASHRLNLAVRLLTATHEEHLNQVQQLMIKLRTLNQAAALRFKTPLRRVLRQDTRWGSTFGMLRCYFELLEFVDRNDDSLAEDIPSAAANRQLRSLLENLKMVESVSKRIQTVTVSV